MIYYLEDDKNIRDLVVYTLGKSGHQTKGFCASEELFAAVAQEIPALILLDIMLPGEDGLTVLKRLRANKATAEIPVIMITAKGTEYDKVLGLDTGADDYLAKPFGMMELVARVNAMLRRTSPGSGQPDITAGRLRVSPAKYTAWVDHSPVALTRKEFELLLFLLENKGIVFGRDKLLSSIWGYDYLGSTRTVDVHIQTLRQKLMACGQYIETVRGVGYRFGDTCHDQ